MIHKKFSIILRVTLSFLLALLITIPTSATNNYDLPDEVLDILSANNAYYYNPQGDCSNPQGITGIGGSSGGGNYTGNISGNSNAAKIWNYFVSANIPGFSNNAAAIAGVMGNLQQESSFSPYALSGNGIYHGLYQTNAQTIISAVNEQAGSYWGNTNVPDDINDKALKIELDYLVNDQVFPSESRFSIYVNAVRSVPNTADGAQIAAELFLVAFERAYGGKEYLSSSEAQRLASDLNIGSEKWQEAGLRRNYAVGAYNSFANSTPTSSDSSNPSSDTFYNPSTSVDGDTDTNTSTSSSVTIIGDSITVGATSQLKSLLPSANINAEVGRQFTTGIDILKNTTPGDTLVFALGTNDSGLRQSQVDEVLNLANSKGVKKIIFVTNYSSKNPNTYSQNNALLSSTASSNSNVYLVDWAAAAGADPSKYIGSDGIHPTTAGQELFAQLVSETVGTSASTNASPNYSYNNPITTSNFCTSGISSGSPYSSSVGTGATGSYNGSSSGSPYTGNEIPQYNQCDSQWGNLMFGSGGIYGSQGSTICKAGCGPTSFAMMATALTHTVILPSDTADVAGRAGMYVSGSGSNWSITQVLANKYGLQYADLGTCNIETINQYLRSGWMIHTSGAGSEPFSSGGHYIGIVGVNTNGEWLIANSGKVGNRYYAPSVVVNAGMKCGNVKAVK